jgi:hypothetical protein
MKFVRFEVPIGIHRTYHVHHEWDGFRLNFDVYPVSDWESIIDGSTGTYYTDIEKEPDIRETFEEGKCLKKLSGSMCWRGVWEGRLYFTDQEYWDEELAELSALFSDHIEPWAKDFIREKEGSELEP